jgi:hypothetical protein
MVVKAAVVVKEACGLARLQTQAEVGGCVRSHAHTVECVCVCVCVSGNIHRQKRENVRYYEKAGEEE